MSTGVERAKSSDPDEPLTQEVLERAQKFIFKRIGRTPEASTVLKIVGNYEAIRSAKKPGKGGRKKKKSEREKVEPLLREGGSIRGVARSLGAANSPVQRVA